MGSCYGIARIHLERSKCPTRWTPACRKGGWVNAMMLRQFEHLIGYTTTSKEFVEACGKTGGDPL